MRHTLHTLFKSTVESIVPPSSKSQFEEKRVLTPEEFVAAGDTLVHACPTWAWEGGDPKKRRSYFPAAKQYLVTRNVPCLRRASALEGYDPNTEVTVAAGGGGGEGGEEEEAWVATHADPTVAGGGGSGAAAEHIPSIDGDDDAAAAAAGGSGGTAAGTTAARHGGGDDDIPDITELELREPEDQAAAPSSRPPGYLSAEEPAEPDPILRTRTYDLHITYDQYYQVPRFWLVGYDESRRPLLPQQVMEDVSEEHARKTITHDPHPHLAGLSAASIHPCRHAEVMKKLADNLVEAGRSFGVEQYLILFLKFIASVVPTIQYDYTMQVGGE